MLHQRRPTVSALIAAMLLLTGCASQVITVTVTTPPETIIVTATPEPTTAPTSQPPQLKTLTVCLVGEPDTLYLYGGSRLTSTKHVMEAIYDGPIDYVDYAYQPVILQKIPSIADGDALTRTMSVRAGSRVVSADGTVVDLAEGMWVRPAGCYDDDCVVEFDGETLWMERMEVTFALREDITWSDGHPITMTDSLFAFQVASDPATPGNHYLAERTARYRVIDDYHVQWVGVPGFRTPTYALNFFAPLPRHQLEGREPEELLQAEETRRRPMGWGPFVVDEWSPGERIILSRNPHYYRLHEGLPYLDQVIFEFYANAPKVAAGLLSGDCDIGTHDADFEQAVPLLVEAEERGLLNVVSTINNGWEHIDFGIDPVPSYARPDFFGDLRVRQAIIQCIDRQAIVDEIAYGNSVVPDSYLPPGHPLYAGTYLLHWGHNPPAGRALLEEVGWLDNDEDGVRESRGVRGIPTGTPFEVTLLTSSDSPASQQVARIIKAHLADCGIRLNLETRSSWELFADGPEGPLFGRQFDMVETAWWFDIVPLCGHYMTSEIPDIERWYGDNITGYANPDYDAICQAALQALPGTPEYNEYHKQTQIIFSEELPAIPLFMWLRVAVVGSNVLNFGLDSTSPSELWIIETLDVE
jgi:peptide/nickel transport system substrate-binding protein